ncbi:glycerate kinase, partial [Vibrio sp. NO3-D2]|nr:glycerate kinase [Vibrio sp. NO3-D2]
ACDVDNPLVGIRGASFVFGRQKGANTEMVKELDENLKHYASILKQYLSCDVSEIPGAGAAGGMGAAIIAVLKGSLRRGIEIVLDYTACDVDNPLVGIRGASFVFGRQKGANTEMVKEL